VISSCAIVAHKLSLVMFSPPHYLIEMDQEANGDEEVRLHVVWALGTNCLALMTRRD